MNKLNIALFGILLIILAINFIENNRFQKKLNDDLLIIKSMIEDLDYDIHELKKE